MRIKIKDHGTGIISHNNLGQISIPIPCFLPETEALLIVPVEPATSMPMTAYDLGELKVTTEMVVLADLLPPPLQLEGKGGVSVLEKGVSNTSVSSPTLPRVIPKAELDSMGEAHVAYVLKQPGQYEIWWWPCKLMVCGSSPDPINAHVLCDFDSLYIKFEAAVGPRSEITSCVEFESPVESSQFLRVPWWQVKFAESMTDSVVLISVEVHKQVGGERSSFTNSSDKFSAGLGLGGMGMGIDAAGPPPSTQPRELLIVVAPVPAASLEVLISERVLLADLRAQLKRFISVALHISGESAAERRERTNGAWTDDAVLSVARGLMANIEQECAHPRAKLYLAQLIHSCSVLPFGPPVDTISLKGLVAGDIEEATAAIPCPSDSLSSLDDDETDALTSTSMPTKKLHLPVKVAVDRILVLVDLAVLRIRDIALFYASSSSQSSYATMTTSQSSSPAQPSLGTASKDDDCFERFRRNLEIVLKLYHTGMRDLVLPYIGLQY